MKKRYLIMAAVLSLFLISGDISTQTISDTDLSDIPLNSFQRAVQNLRILAVSYSGGKVLLSANSSIRVHGKLFIANQGGFRGALYIEQFTLPAKARELIKKGKINVSDVVNTYLRNPGKRSINVVVVAPYGDDTDAYLEDTARIKVSGSLVYMTGGSLDSDQIKSACESSGKVLLSGNSKEEEWVLWTGLSGSGSTTETRKRHSVTAPGYTGYTSLISSGRNAEERKDLSTAYHYYKRACNALENMKDLSNAERDLLRRTKTALRRVEWNNEAAKEKRAFNKLSRTAGTTLQRIIILRNTYRDLAEQYPDTPSGEYAAGMAGKLDNMARELNMEFK